MSDKKFGHPRGGRAMIRNVQGEDEARVPLTVTTPINRDTFIGDAPTRHVGPSHTAIAEQALRSPPSDGSERLGPGAGQIRFPPNKKLAHILWRNAKQHKSLLEQQFGFDGSRGTIKRKISSSVALGYLPDNPDTICPYCGASAPLVDRVKHCVGCGAVILEGEYLGPVEKLAHTQWRNVKQLIALLEKEYGFGQKEDHSKEGDDWRRHGRLGIPFPAGPGNENVCLGNPPERQEVTPSGQVVTVSGKNNLCIDVTPSDQEKRQTNLGGPYVWKEGGERQKPDTILKPRAKVRKKGTEWPVYHIGKNTHAIENDGASGVVGSETLDMLKELEAKGELELVGQRQSTGHSLIGREPVLDC